MPRMKKHDSQIFTYQKNEIVKSYEVPEEIQYLFDDPQQRHWVDQHNPSFNFEHDFKVYQNVSIEVRNPEVVISFS
jgi:hypothetical protein